VTDSQPNPNDTTVPGALPAAAPPPPAAEAPAPSAEPAPAASALPGGLVWGTGRRKSSVARVRLLPGDGKFLINARPHDVFFRQLRDQTDVVAPLEMANVRRQYDVFVNVRGGGVTGQAGAVKLGVARAVIQVQSQHEQALRDAGFLTRDAREVERKKYGRRKARRRFQFSKR
jgi:small subunit ribosomal protein S9